MKHKYALRCIAPDGDFVTERGYKSDGYASIEEAEEAAANLGSKWWFYPINIITTHGSAMSSHGAIIRGVSCGIPKDWIGRTLKTFCRAIKEHPVEVEKYIEGRAPLLLSPTLKN